LYGLGIDILPCGLVSDFSPCSRLNFLQVFGDLYPSAMQLQMVSVPSVLKAMGYGMQTILLPLLTFAIWSFFHLICDL
jgi:hypothetical protein